MLFIKILIICVLYINLEIYADNVQIKLEGLNDLLKDNVLKKLANVKSSDINIDQYFQNKIIEAIYSGLQPLGYYSPKIKFFLYESSLKKKIMYY